MKPDHVCAAQSVVQIKIDCEHYLPLEEVFLGDATVQHLGSTDEITSSDLKKFRDPRTFSSLMKWSRDMLILVVHSS